MSTRWKDLVQKLLQKAEDPATPEPERISLQEKAISLMAKFGIEAAMLSAAEDKPLVVDSSEIDLKNPYALKKSILINGISKTFGCMAISLNSGNVKVVGFADDIDKVKTLYNSLLIQMIYGLSSAQSSKPAWEHGKTFNDSYLKGYIHVVLERVRKAYQKAREDVARTTTGTDLVLYNRAQLVKKEFNRQFPQTRQKSTVGSRSSSAHGLGQRDGYSANIGQSGIGGSRRAISS